MKKLDIEKWERKNPKLPENFFDENGAIREEFQPAVSTFLTNCEENGAWGAKDEAEMWAIIAESACGPELTKAFDSSTEGFDINKTLIRDKDGNLYPVIPNLFDAKEGAPEWMVFGGEGYLDPNGTDAIKDIEAAYTERAKNGEMPIDNIPYGELTNGDLRFGNSVAIKAFGKYVA